LIEVGGKDVRLFGKIGRTTDNVVFSIFYFVDKGSAFLVKDNLDTVAYRYRVGTSDSFESEITFDFTFDKLSVIALYLVPAT